MPARPADLDLAGSVLPSAAAGGIILPGAARRPIVAAPPRDAGRPVSCLANLGAVENAGALARVSPDGHRFAVGRVFADVELARLLCRKPEVLTRWRICGMFPEPQLRDDRGRHYYADLEVYDFVGVLGRHQERSRSYRPTHVAVRAKLFESALSGNQATVDAWMALNS